MSASYSSLILLLEIIFVNCHPIDPKVVLPRSDGGIGFAFLGTLFFITTVVGLVSCLCCRQRRDGFKEFQNPELGGSSEGAGGFSNALASELSIFPPPSAAGGGGTGPGAGVTGGGLLLGATSPLHRPAAAFSTVTPSISDWFSDPSGNFPRQLLFYKEEIGKGWFGKVVKGEARSSKVVVRILREDATPEERAYFLDEARVFRDLTHKNIARLYGRCLEADPFLLIFHFSANSDLKSFLVTNSGSRNAITEQKISLKMMLDVTEGLKYMNEQGFIHTDLAARNCLVESDLTVKIGDYGTSIDKYKNEYYITGEMAVPLRWCAPESLTISPTTIQTNQVTEAGNVWSLGVTLWEIAEFGRLPYSGLSDEQVILQLFGTTGGGLLRLEQPHCSYGEYLYNIMSSCWRADGGGRASVEEVLEMLTYLKNNPFQDEDFEARWKALKPNSVPVIDNHTPIHSPRHTLLAQRPHLPVKLEFDSGVDLEIKTVDENSARTVTPVTSSPQLSVASEDIFQAPLKEPRSPSLTNLKGSFEEVHQLDSWLTGVEQKTDEDRTFVKNISDVIKNLDDTLALEKTSSSSADSSMEETKKPLLDFRLGPQEDLSESRKPSDSILQFRLGPQEGTSSDLRVKSADSSSESEEETWRKRIERGEFSEKVKEKSKSVTDLMVLTHIESEGSESDSLPSLTRQYSTRKGGVTFTSVGFGSEGNIRNAVLSDELQEKLKQLSLWKTDSTDQSFLGIRASETIHHLFKPTKKINNVTSICKSLNVSKCEKTVISKNVNTQNEKSDVPEAPGVDLKCGSESSQSNEELSVPKIVITKSEFSPEFEEEEPESNLDLFFVHTKPRRFVLVCQDFDDEDSPSSNETRPSSVCDNFSQKINSDLSLTPDSSPETNDCTVILGPSNEHTLDYFKGLKTTFMPAEEESPPTHDYIELQSESAGDVESDVSIDNFTDQTDDKSSDNFKDNPLPDFVPDIPLDKSSYSSQFETNDIDNLIEKSLEQSAESKLLFDKNNAADFSLLISSTTEDITRNNEDEDCEMYINLDRDKTFNSNDSLSTDSPLGGTNFVISSSPSDSGSPSSENSSEELVEAPYPFNQPLISESKSLDSFLRSRNDPEHMSNSVNGGYYEPNDSKKSNYVPIFHMTESVSENAFNNKNNSYDPYFSVDSGHSSDRCIEQDKQMNDLKSRLEDVVKSGSDYQLKNSEEEYGGKLLTPDDERSSDSGFRDKGSLSESVEDTCDEKYNLEDIDAELDDFPVKSINNDEYRYYEKFVNEPDLENSGWFVKMEASKENGWLSQSTENEESLDLSISADFAAAIRNELRDKVPGLIPSDKKSDDENSPETEEMETNTDSVTQFIYPSQLSPILEEQESNQSSLNYNEESPSIILPPPDPAFRDEDQSKGSDVNVDLFSDDRTLLDEDLLIVDTETNEARMIESPRPQSLPTFIIPPRIDDRNTTPVCPDNDRNTTPVCPDNDRNTTPVCPDNDRNTTPVCPDNDRNTTPVCPDNDRNAPVTPDNDRNAPVTPDNDRNTPVTPDNDRYSPVASGNDPNTPVTPDNDRNIPVSPDNDRNTPVTPDNDRNTSVSPDNYCVLSPDNAPLSPISIGSGTHSSSENGNLSGFFLSPCSIRSDLFDSGPPSLPFDLGQSLEEVEDLPVQNVNQTFDPTEDCDHEREEKTPVFNESLDTLSLESVNGYDNPNYSKEMESKDISSYENPVYIIADVNDNCRSEVNTPITSEVKSEQNCFDNPTYGQNGNDCEFESSNRNVERILDINSFDNPAYESGKPTKENVEITKQTENVEFVNNVTKCDNEKIIESAKYSNIEAKNDKKRDSSLDISSKLKTSWLKDFAFSAGPVGLSESKVSSFGSKIETSPVLDETTGVSGEKKLGLVTSTLALLSPDLGWDDGGDTSVTGGRNQLPEGLSSPDEGWRPTISQLMELTEAAAAGEPEEMTTSFIDPDPVLLGSGDPLATSATDWDSDLSESSSSGEFLWKDTPLPGGSGMSRIDEEEDPRDESSSSSSDSGEESSDGEESSSEGSAEFRPSSWSPLSAPVKSILSPLNKPVTPREEKKRVVFKREKYQCVYEYPREEEEEEDESCSSGSDCELDSEPGDAGLRAGCLGRPTGGQAAVWASPPATGSTATGGGLFDYSVFTDWELSEGEGTGVAGTGAQSGESPESDTEEGGQPANGGKVDFDFYRLDYNLPLSAAVNSDWKESLPDSDSEFSPLASDLTPVGLGDLRHTKANLRLELPALRPADHLGEASILESGSHTA